MRRCKCVECRVGKCSCVIEQFNDSSILLIRVCVAVKVCVCERECVLLWGCVWDPNCLYAARLFSPSAWTGFWSLLHFFPPFFFLCWFILDFIAKGLPSGRCQPALDRATDKEARVGPQSCTSHTLANSLQPESLVVILLGVFCLFSPDGETSSIRCLIFPQHSLCHKCTVCVHLLLPSLPSRVGFFFFSFFFKTSLCSDWDGNQTFWLPPIAAQSGCRFCAGWHEKADKQCRKKIKTKKKQF